MSDYRINIGVVASAAVTAVQQSIVALKRGNAQLREVNEILKSPRVHREQSTSYRYTFMKAHLDSYSMTSLCQALSVSKSGYYAWVKRSERTQRHIELHEAIRVCHQARKAKVGAPSIHAELRCYGFEVCTDRKSVV